MAIMIPDSLDPNTKSRAERRLFNRLSKELSDEFVVLHSLGIARHSDKRWGECDFVLISPVGVFFIEVKGGGVACKDGMWHFTNRNGHTAIKHESPWAQAKTAMFSVKAELDSLLDTRGLLFGFGVVMPNEEFLLTGPEIEQDYLLDRRNWHRPLQEYFERLQEVWRINHNKMRGKNPKKLDYNTREEIRKSLRPDSVSRYRLSQRLEQAEDDLIELTAEQGRILEALSETPRMIIEGTAGTGKTLLAVEQAIRKCADGSTVLFLCFNRLLAHHLEQVFKAATLSRGRVLVRTLHQMYMDHIIESGRNDEFDRCKRAAKNNMEFYDQIFPALFEEAVVELCPEPYDAIIIDEGQDILTLAHINALDLILKFGVSGGNWWIFMDPLQNIYQKCEINKVLDLLLQYGMSRFKLSVNCRNTVEVALTTAIVSRMDMTLKGAVRGGFRETVEYDERGIKKPLEKLLRRLENEGIDSRDIIVLGTRRLEKSSLSEAKTLNGKEVYNLSHGESSGGLAYCTMHAFKGLERRLVIAIDVYEESGDAEERRTLLYSGLSRAVSGLILMVPKGHVEMHNNNLASLGERLARLDA